MSRAMPRVGQLVRALALPCMVGLFLALPAVPAGAATPSHFAYLDQPVGVASTKTALLVTQWQHDRVLSLDSSGTATLFANLPSTGDADLERYIMVSPGLGGFPKGYIYVTQKQTIYRINPSGSTVKAFVTIPDLPNSNNLIAFDTVGTFDYDMIIAGGKRGKIYRVTSTGSYSVVADLDPLVIDLQEPAVAPPSFAPYGGQLLVPTKYGDTVYAVTASGDISTVATYDSAGQVIFIPRTVCSFGSSGGAWFVAMQDQGEILKFPASDFTGLSNNALVTGEITTTVGLMSSSGGVVTISPFADPLGIPNLEGTVFAAC